MNNSLSHPDEGWLFRDYMKEGSDAFYAENPHFKFLLTKLVRPVLFVALPIVAAMVWYALVAWLPRPGNPAGFDIVKDQVEAWLRQFFAELVLPDITVDVINTVAVVAVLFVIYFVVRAFYAWRHTFYIISSKGVVLKEASSWFFFLRGGKLNINDPQSVKGAAIHEHTLIEQLVFRNCATVSVLVVDLENSHTKLEFGNVTDPRRMERAVDQLRSSIREKH